MAHTGKSAPPFFNHQLTGEIMKRPLNRIEHFQRILRTLGSRCAAAYAVKHGMSVEAAICAVRGARHA